MRRLSNREMADTPARGWINPKVDVLNYYVTFTKAWETSKIVYDQLIKAGACGQEVSGKYIITNH